MAQAPLDPKTLNQPESIVENPKSEVDKKLGIEVPTIETVMPIVRNFSSAIQFKNSLNYIQGGTNVTLDRMIAKFDIVLAEIYLQGVQDGLSYAKTITETKVGGLVSKI